jgi:hypothetical protein
MNRVFQFRKKKQFSNKTHNQMKPINFSREPKSNKQICHFFVNRVFTLFFLILLE